MRDGESQAWRVPQLDRVGSEQMPRVDMQNKTFRRPESPAVLSKFVITDRAEAEGLAEVCCHVLSDLCAKVGCS